MANKGKDNCMGVKGKRTIRKESSMEEKEENRTENEEST